MAPKVTESYKEEKRQTLLLSALHCFAQQGFQATTIDDIVQHAGVSKGMLYTYFPSKEDIYLQIMEAQTEQSIAAVMAQFQLCATPTEKLKLLMKRFREVPLDEKNRQFLSVHLEFWLHATRQDELRGVLHERYQRHIDLVKSVILEGIATGEFRRDVPVEDLSAIFWAMRDGISLHFIHLGHQEDYMRVCDVASAMLYRFLGVE